MQEKIKLYNRSRGIKTGLISLALVLALVLTLAACSEKPSGEGDMLTPAPETSAEASASKTASSDLPKSEIHIMLDSVTRETLDGTEPQNEGTGKLYYSGLANKLIAVAEKYNSEQGGKVIIDSFERKLNLNGTKYELDDSKSYIENYTNDGAYKAYQSTKKSGTPPDIILFAPYLEYGADGVPDASYDGSAPFIEWYKYIKNGDLADMTPYLEADAGYTREDYVEAVMDGGMYGGQQYFIPLMYQANMYSGIYEKSEVTGAPTPESFTTFADFWGQYAKASDYTEAEGVAVQAYAGPDLSTSLPLYSGAELFDIGTGRLRRGDAAFETVARTYFEAGNQLDICGPDPNDPINSVALGNIERDQAAIATCTPDAWMSYYYVKMSNIFTSTPLASESDNTAYTGVIPFIDDAKKTVAPITLALGVSESSENKQSAYDFIMYCLNDAEFCSDIGKTMYGYHASFPVKRDTLEKYVLDEQFRSSSPNLSDDKGIELGKALIDKVVSVAMARPLYLPLTRSYEHNFRGIFELSADKSTDEKLAELYDAMDADMAIYWAN